MTGLAHHDARTLFERAWSQAVASGLIDAARREALVAEATRAIRRIASVLGTEFLRDDLERAMRSMLGLVELHLMRVSDGDVVAAAHSLAANGLLFHTKGASQSIKRMLANEHGVDPERLGDDLKRRFEADVVAHWATVPFEVLAEREAEAERMRARRAAAAALSAGLPGEAPDLDFNGAEQVILTALLIRVYAREPAWIGDSRGFEALLATARRAPGRFLELPEDLPPEHVDVIEEVWREQGGDVLEAIVDPTVPLHVLVGGDPDRNPLQSLLALPTGDAIGDLDELGEFTTSHWQALTGGATDDDRLLAVMLSGVLGLDLAWPIGPKAAELLVRTRLTAKPPQRAITDWLEANAPHPYHADLLDLWDTFWEALEDDIDAGSSSASVRAFAREWLPVREPRRA